MIRFLLLPLAALAFLTPAQAAEPLPGDPCTGANNLQFSSGPEVAAGGGHAMLCQGGTWKAILSFDSTAGLTNLGNQTCATNEILKFNGTKWACAADGGGSVVWQDGGSGKLYYNSGNVGIGLANPESALHVSATSGLLIDRFAGVSRFEMRRANGVSGSPTAVQSGEVIANFAGIGYGSTAYQTSASGAIKIIATEAFSDTAGGGAITFSTHQTGTVVQQERLRIDSLGNIGIGTIAPDTKLHVTGTIKLGDGAELCNAAAHEGAIRYVAATDKFQMCRAAGTGWEDIGTGGGNGSSGSSFFVHKNGTNQAISANTYTKLTWSTEVFDTDNSFASNRFTPTKAGKYIINLTARCAGSNGECYAVIYKNGTTYAGSSDFSTGDGGPSLSTIVDMNGSTDYVEAFVWSTSAGSVLGSYSLTHFSGAMIGGGGSGSDTLADLSCTTGQVAAWNGTAWACAANGGSGGGASSSMVSGWPDALVCTSGSVSRYMPLAAKANGFYYYQTNDSANTAFTIWFNDASGAYVSHQNMSGYDCLNQSISQLRTANKAFNFVGGSSASGSSTWVRYEGATGNILGSSNVSSVTRTAAGNWTISFATPMPNANYAVVCSGDHYEGVTWEIYLGYLPTSNTTNETKIIARNAASGDGYDPRHISCIIESGSGSGGGGVSNPAACSDGEIPTWSTSSSALVCVACPIGWLKSNGRCYIAVTTNRNWSAAQADCVSMGGALASIKDEQENTYVRSLINPTQSAWIGGTDNSGWKWSDNQPFAFTKWHSGEPSTGAGGGEGCVEIYSVASGSTWNDAPCSNTRPYICKK